MPRQRERPAAALRCALTCGLHLLLSIIFKRPACHLQVVFETNAGQGANTSALPIFVGTITVESSPDQNVRLCMRHT